MTTFGVLTANATSLNVVAQDIVYAINKLGHDAKLYNRQIQWHEAKKLFKRGIIFIPFDPAYALIWFLLQRDYCKVGIPSVTYVTVEGLPLRTMIREWVRRDCTFIANSRFTESMLKRVDVEVKDVIYHGVNFDLIKQTKQTQQLKKQLNAKVVFGTVASQLPRKGLDRLAQAIKTTSEKLEDAKFYILTTPAGRNNFIGMDNVHVSTNFGKLEREEVVALIGSFDYYICSSLSEGFGLPLLEAQAFGIPVIYPDYSPLSEITHPTANFPIDVAEEEYVRFMEAIDYLFHHYNPNDMADQIEKAYETYTCKPLQYQKISQQVKEFAQQFDILKTYSKFITE